VKRHARHRPDLRQALESETRNTLRVRLRVGRGWAASAYGQTQSCEVPKCLAGSGLSNLRLTCAHFGKIHESGQRASLGCCDDGTQVRLIPGKSLDPFQPLDFGLSVDPRN
jgi:hypothetical protein